MPWCLFIRGLIADSYLSNYTTTVKPPHFSALEGRWKHHRHAHLTSESILSETYRLPMSPHYPLAIA